MNLKTNLNKTNLLCIVGIIVGIIFMINGISIIFGKPLHVYNHYFWHPLESNYIDLTFYTFKNDFYTETYHALYSIGQWVGNIYLVLGQLLTAFGIFVILFFGIKLKWHGANEDSTDSKTTA